MKKNNTQTLIWLKKAKTLLEKIIDMIVKDTYCIDVIQQNLAVIGLLKSANLNLLEGHLGCCFVDAVKKNDEKKIDEMIGEVLTIVKTAQNK